MSSLLDTSFLYALADTSDRNHARVSRVAQSVTGPLVLPQPALTEICYLLASRFSHATMRRFLHQLTLSQTQVEALTEGDLVRVSALLDQYADAELDFVDAALVAIVERRDISRILTLDRRDFPLVRPAHTDYFDILP